MNFIFNLIFYFSIYSPYIIYLYFNFFNFEMMIGQNPIFCEVLYLHSNESNVNWRTFIAFLFNFKSKIN